MSNLISGKDALIALANGEAVECSNISIGEWHELDDNSPLSLLLTGKNRNGFDFQFRLKPRTITINGITCQDENEAINLVKGFFK